MNKKTSFLINFHFIMASLVILFILFTPFFTYAGTLYRCVDTEGNETATDHLVGGSICKPIDTFKDMTDEERTNYDKEKEVKEKKRTEEYEKLRPGREAKRNLDNCFDSAHSRYKAGWDGDCRLLNLYSGCDLPVENAKRWDYNLQEEKNQCLQLYRQKP